MQDGTRPKNAGEKIEMIVATDLVKKLNDRDYYSLTSEDEVHRTIRAAIRESVARLPWWARVVYRCLVLHRRVLDAVRILTGRKNDVRRRWTD
jgi:hypothetical protein